MRFIVVSSVALWAAAPALACPLCDSQTADEVRAGLFDEQFGSNLVALLLPFPILILIVLALHFDLAGRAGRAAAQRLGGSALRTEGANQEADR